LELNGSQIMIEELKAGGVEIAFGIPGGAIMPFYDELLKSEFPHILTRHEQGAAHMADGYARVSNKIAAVITTSGPGATNLITGLANAHMDSIPMIAITGQVASPMIGTDAFQEADTYGCSIPVTKYNWLIQNVNDIQKITKEAIKIATTGRPGPVLIDFPKDIQVERTTYQNSEYINSGQESSPELPEESLHGIDELISALKQSKKPLILAGAGILKARASNELTKFARNSGIPVINTLLGLGGFPGTDNLFLGMPGMHGTAYANFALDDCDLLINLGGRFDDRVTGKTSGFCKQAKICHVDIDPVELGKRIHTDIPILGNVREVLKILNEDVGELKCEDWLQKIKNWKSDFPLSYENSDSIKPQFVIEKIQKLTNGDAIYATGVGQHQMWSAQFIRFNEPNSWVSSGGLGTMGFGLPAAIGAKIARPEKEVWLIDGDGSFAMTLTELATAAQYGIPVKVAILNNGYLGMVRQWQELFFEKRYSHSHYPKNPDFKMIAEGYGVHGIDVESPDQVLPSLEEASSINGPVVINFHVDKGENVWPMVPAGAANSEMQLKQSKSDTQ
jgi:acetolactate synthase-1/2/3 large subunit